MKFDDWATIRRLDVLENWTEAYRAWQKDIRYIANNINQIAHYGNVMKEKGIITETLIKNRKIVYLSGIIS